MPIPIEIINGKKTVTVLENNPQVMNALSAHLGLSPTLQFHDVYSLTDSDLLSLIPSPIHALLVIFPLTPSWHADRDAEDETFNKSTSSYPSPDLPPQTSTTTSSSSEPIIWFPQTIGHACGSIGLLHSLINGSARHFLSPSSLALSIRTAASPLSPPDRAQLLYSNDEFLAAHQSVAELGDTTAPDAATGDRLGQHFVSFVKGEDGCVWELEGGRKGPINRGYLGEDGLLSKRGVELSIGRVVELEKKSGGGDLRFSCIALAGGEE